MKYVPLKMSQRNEWFHNDRVCASHSEQLRVIIMKDLFLNAARPSATHEDILCVWVVIG